MDVGNEVICIKSINWHVENGPKKGDVLIISDSKEKNGVVYLKFNEYSTHGYRVVYFRKLITDHTESFESSELSRRLANKPQIKEGVEKTKTKKNAEH